MENVAESYDTHEEDAFSERSLVSDLRDLVDHGRDFVESEIELQKARAAYVASGAPTIAILAVAAGLLVFFAFVALTVGLVIALAPLMSGLGAAAAVFAAFLIVAFLLAKLAAGRWRKMTAVLADPVSSK